MQTDEIPSNTIEPQTLQNLKLPDSVNTAVFTLNRSLPSGAGLLLAGSPDGIYPATRADGTLGNESEICFRSGSNEANEDSPALFEPLPENPHRLRVKPEGLRIMSKYRLKNAAAELLPEFRVHHCSYRLLPGAYKVGIYRRADGKSASYGNLMRCESVHVCPVCSEYETQKSRHKLQIGVDNWIAAGGGVVMITRTSQHTAADALQVTLSRQLDALRRMKGTRAYNALALRFGIVHTVRNLEATWGVLNGWHPHTHELLFLERALKPHDLADLEQLLNQLWRSYLAKVGAFADVEHGFKMSANRAAIADYVSKQGFNSVSAPEGNLAAEMALGKTKRGRVAGRFTPFQLLIVYARGKSTPEGKLAGQLFREYGLATKGRSHLHWSKGAQEALGISEASLQAAMEAAMERVPAYAALPLPVWKWIRERGLQGEILALVLENEYREGFEDALRRLGAEFDGDLEPEPGFMPGSLIVREAPESHNSGSDLAPERRRQLRLIYPPPVHW